MRASWTLVVAAVLSSAASASAAPKDRPLPGFGGVSYRDVELKGGCTDQVRVVRRTKKVDDPELVTLLTWPRIKGLDFSPDDAVKARTSMRRFQEWFQKLQAQASKVRDRQAALARDATLPAAARVEAVARLVLAEQQVVDLILGIEVPRHLRTDPEIVDAYCDVLSEQTEPLEAEIDQTRGFCAKLAADLRAGPGWWTDVCKVPAAPASQPSP